MDTSISIPGNNGGVLHPMQKGEPARSNGRPKGSVSFKTLFDKVLSGEIDVTEAGKSRKVTKREAIALGLLRDALTHESPDVRLRAAREIMDRTEGKPTQKVEQSGGLEITTGINPDALDMAEKRTLVALYEKAKPTPENE